jgi:SpoVK/Ycf46/Vps4 family AAA+-type ATPase
MASLTWGISWKYGYTPLTPALENAIIAWIKTELPKKKNYTIYSNDIGYSLEGSIQNKPFSVKLQKIDPSIGFTDYYYQKTEFIIKKMESLQKTDELDDFTTFQSIFSPHTVENQYYKTIYESLVGIPKENILKEIQSLLIPFEKKQEWSRRYYHREIPALTTTANKAPVIILGGDPGTGKTALSTSIGAVLAEKLNQRVHFRHLGLMMRGMGYQGRASSMIVKLFEQIKNQYTRYGEPMILFFDEAEAIVGSREQADSSSGAQENLAIVDSIIIGVDSLRKGQQAQIVALFATNLTGKVDPALLRRGYYYQFNRPDDEARQKLWESSLSGMNFSEMDIKDLVEATKPQEINGKEIAFTASDIVELIISRALNDAIISNVRLTKDLLLRYCDMTQPAGSFAK